MHEQGVATLRFNFPYVEAGDGCRARRARDRDVGGGRRSPASAPALTPVGRRQVVRRTHGLDGGGGGAIAPAGLVYLGYPLHPPGEPAKARVAHLPRRRAAAAVRRGHERPVHRPALAAREAVASCQDATIAWIEGGGHSFEVKGRKRPPTRSARPRAARGADCLRARV
jgi:predicted alpha/beta-hydrolase family hydrolase